MSGNLEGTQMDKRTCAACDQELDSEAIEVTIGGKTVEACCTACAQKLNETQPGVAQAKKS